MKRKKPTPKRDKLRKAGEHWYEVIDLFDPSRIQNLGGRMFIMGKLDEVVIVEVPENVTPQAVNSLQARLKQAGVKSPAFAIQAGIRFLKLKALVPEEETTIEAALAEREKARDVEQKDASNPGA